MIRKLVIVVVAMAALVLSPFYGCGRPGFQFDADDMRAAVEGVWVVKIPATTDAPAREITISIAQAGAAEQEERTERSGLVREAAACSNRTLVRSAEACIDSSKMPLEVERIAGLDTTGTLGGTFTVNGSTFRAGWLEISLGEDTVIAVLSPTGEASEVIAAMGGGRLDATLTRISRQPRD